VTVIGSVTCIADLKCRVGESPVWDDATGHVLLCDFYGQVIHAVDPARGLVRTRTFFATVGSFGLCKDGARWIVAVGDGVYIFDLLHESTDLLVRPLPGGK
jgi:sugar lactone lactonase YvrE